MEREVIGKDNRYTTTAYRGEPAGSLSRERRFNKRIIKIHFYRVHLPIYRNNIVYIVRCTKCFTN